MHGLDIRGEPMLRGEQQDVLLSLPVDRILLQQPPLHEEGISPEGDGFEAPMRPFRSCE